MNEKRLKEIAKPRDEKAHEEWLKEYDDSFGEFVNEVEGRV